LSGKTSHVSCPVSQLHSLQPPCAPRLSKVLQDAEELIRPLRELNIERADLLDPVDVRGRRLRALTLVEKVFDSIQRVKAGRRTVGFTAPSKILHMSVPNFFVMSDQKIRRGYGCEGNVAGYANFMFRMSLLARDLISQAHGDKEMILNCSKWRGRTLARLLDNFNYTKYTLGKA